MFEMQLLEMPNKNLTVILKILKKKSPSSLIFLTEIYIYKECKSYTEIHEKITV